MPCSCAAVPHFDKKFIFQGKIVWPAGWRPLSASQVRFKCSARKISWSKNSAACRSKTTCYEPHYPSWPEIHWCLMVFLTRSHVLNLKEPHFGFVTRYNNLIWQLLLPAMKAGKCNVILSIWHTGTNPGGWLHWWASGLSKHFFSIPSF